MHSCADCFDKSTLAVFELKFGPLKCYDMGEGSVWYSLCAMHIRAIVASHLGWSYIKVRRIGRTYELKIDFK